MRRNPGQSPTARPLFLSAMLLLACGDDTPSGGGGTGGAFGGFGGTAGAGAGLGGMNTTDGVAGGEPTFPACVLAEAEDHTAEAAITIVSEGVKYNPRCVRVSVGTTVTFESDFEPHPLRGGEVVGEEGVVDPNSPITPQDEGTTASFVLNEPGEFPYFCRFHIALGMFGTIWVE